MGRQNRFILVIALVLLTVGRVHAGGLWLYEEATPDMGVGGAGRQAAGMDASTASGNPAAMTRLDRSQIEGGFLGIYADTQFNVKNSSNGDNGGGNAGYFSPAGTMYLRAQREPGLKVWDSEWGPISGWGLTTPTSGRGSTMSRAEASPRRPSTRPSAYKIADWLSVGCGVSAVQGKLSERVAVNTLTEPGDGRLKYDASDVGLWLQPRGAFRPSVPEPVWGSPMFRRSISISVMRPVLRTWTAPLSGRR